MFVLIAVESHKVGQRGGKRIAIMRKNWLVRKETTVFSPSDHVSPRQKDLGIIKVKYIMEL